MTTERPRRDFKELFTRADSLRDEIVREAGSLRWCWIAGERSSRRLSSQWLQEWCRRDRHTLVTKQNTRRVRSHSGATASTQTVIRGQARLAGKSTTNAADSPHLRRAEQVAREVDLTQIPC